ncbi:hypothetical protein NC653_040834 [Populus alba x Populus x berolinensis]|uniref:Uncharacterized protein n=1 Tax=Populus alba x Populus x berolinensis TaxID=444605 RepID=A0AAD6L7C2_9ROSI|nr:hypothetical protein NC653_040834 [Populus alba x Populus x berolinensis]
MVEMADLVTPKTPFLQAILCSGVPGSFHGRLFPEGSIHFFYSCIALHILSKVPEELLHKKLSVMEQGRIHYINAPDEVGPCLNFWESSILDLAREGKISEAQVDSFNLPMYVPSLEEMMELVQKNGCFDIEKMELTSPGVLHESMTNTSSMGKAIVMHVRAGMERMLISTLWK